jgi:hypothetical protein
MTTAAITRSQISSTIMNVNMFMVSGNTTPGDTGVGGIYRNLWRGGCYPRCGRCVVQSSDDWTVLLWGPPTIFFEHFDICVNCLVGGKYLWWSHGSHARYDRGDNGGFECSIAYCLFLDYFDWERGHWADI